MVDGGHDGRVHLGHSYRDGLPLRGHEDDFLVDVDPVAVPQEAGDHQLGPVADGVDGAVLQHDALVPYQKDLQRHDHPAQVALVFMVVVLVLRVQDVVHGHQVLALVQGPTSHAAKLLHVAPGPGQQAEVDAEGPDVGPGLAADVEDPERPLLVELDQGALVNRPHAQLALHCTNQRRALEQGPGEGFDGLGHLRLLLDRAVELYHRNVLLPRALLRLYQPGRPVDAYDQAPGDLRVEGTTVAGLLHAQDPAYPGDDFVAARVRRLVQVDDPVRQIILQVSLEWGGPGRDRGVVPGADVEFVVVLQQQRPLGSVHYVLLVGRLYHKVPRHLRVSYGGRTRHLLSSSWCEREKSRTVIFNVEIYIYIYIYIQISL